MIDEWGKKYQDLEVVVKDGHLMLQQKSGGECMVFEEEYKCLGEKWKTVLSEVKTQKKEVEVTARKWWEFTRNKMKMIRWLHRKENDAGLNKACAVRNPAEQLENYLVRGNRINNKNNS